MGNFLHSLPWTLALALAQAGEPTSYPFPADEAARAAAEDGMTPGASPETSLLALGFESAKAGETIDLSLED